MKRALVIQEDLIILKILERLMQVNNYQCKAIRSLDNVSSEDQQIVYDVVISDVLFDGIAPLQAVFQIRDKIMYKFLIMVTNMGQEIVWQELVTSIKVAGFFAVPFDLDQIEKLIV